MRTIILRKGDVEIVAEDRAPLRKKPVLAIRHGVHSIKFAIFNNEAAAEQFMDLLAQFVGAKGKEVEDVHS